MAVSIFDIAGVTPTQSQAERIADEDLLMSMPLQAAPQNMEDLAMSMPTDQGAFVQNYGPGFEEYYRRAQELRESPTVVERGLLAAIPMGGLAGQIAGFANERLASMLQAGVAPADLVRHPVTGKITGAYGEGLLGGRALTGMDYSQPVIEEETQNICPPGYYFDPMTNTCMPEGLMGSINNMGILA